MIRRILGASALLTAVVMSGCSSCGGTPGNDGGTGGGGGGGSSTNTPPTISALAPVTLAEGATQQITVAATDPDGDRLTFTLISPPAWATVAGDVVTLAPTFNDSGSYVLTVQASDGRGGLSAETISVTVTDSGTPPAWQAIAPVTMDENATQMVNLVAIDPDGQAVTYTLAANPAPPAWATLNGSQLTLAPGYDVIVGAHNAMSTFNVFVEARNPAGAFALASVVVTVRNANRPPVFANATETLAEGATSTVQLMATDPDQGDTVSFMFVGTPPSFAMLSGSSLALAPGFLDAANSPYTISLQATDGDLSSSATVTVTVTNTNGPPDFAPLAPFTLNEGQVQQLALAATDPDNDPVSFRAVGTLPAWVSLVNGQVTLSPDYSVGSATPYQLEFEAYDSLAPGHAVARTLAVTVNNINRDPIIQSIADVTIAELATQQIDLAPLASDPDGESLTFIVTDDRSSIGTTSVGQVGQFVVSNSRIILNPQTGTFLLTPVTVTVEVRDPAMRSAITTFRVFINSTNTAPTVANLQQFDSFNTVMMPGADAGPGQVTLRGTTTDPQGDNVKLQAEVRPVGDTFASPSGVASGASYFEGALGQRDAGVEPTVAVSSLPAGDYKWQVRAVDESGLAGPWVPYNMGNLAFRVPVQDVTGTVAINNGAATTQTRNVSMNMNLSPGAGATSILTVELSDVASFDGGVANIFPYSANAPWTLPTGVGLKTVYVKATDNLLRTATFSDAIVLDDSIPVIDSFVINSNSAATNQGNVTLSFTTSDVGTGVATVEASNDGTTFSPVTSGGTWALTAGDGVKTVTLRITDGAGNVRTGTDTIVLDTAPPVLSSVVINAGAAYTNNTATTVAITATDTGSGLVQACLTESSPYNCVPFTMSGSVAFTLSVGDALKSVQVKVRDAAGNENAVPVADSIVLDTTPPTVTGVSVNAGAAWTTTTGVSVTMNANDANGIAGLAFSINSTSAFGSNQAYVPAGNALTLAAPDGNKRVYVRLTDPAGNTSAVGMAASDDIGLDTTPPAISSFSVNAGATGTNSVNAFLHFVASDTGSGLGGSAFTASNDGTTFTAISNVSPAAFTLTAGDGAKTVTLRVTDAAGNVSQATDGIALDATPPTLTSVTLQGGRAFTNQSNISVATVAGDTGGSGLAQLCITNSGQSEQCVAYVASYSPWALTAGQGTKTVIVTVRDGAGNVSSPIAPTITVDTSAPTLSGLSVNAGAAYTNSSNVTVTGTAADTGGSGVVQIALSNDGTTFGAWTSYVALGNAHTLAAGEGLRTAYAKVRDAADNESAVTSDAITIDTTPPSGTVVVAGGANAINSTATTFVVSATDASGVSAMCVRESLTTPAANDPCFVAYSTTATALTLTAGDGTKTVRAWFRDASGLVSTTAATDTVVLDTVAPSLSGVSINGGAAFTNQLVVSVGFTAADTTTSVAQVCVSSSGTSPLGGCTAYVNPAPFTIAAGDGTKTVYVQVIDDAGNRSSVSSDTIDLNTTGPVGTVVIAAGAAALNTTSTTYVVSATDMVGVNGMCVRESATAPLATDPCFVAYSTAATALTLSGGDGTKTVYAWFRNTANVVSGAAATDTIVLDTVAPTLSGPALNTGAAFTSATGVSLGFTAADTGGSGLAQVCRSETAGSPQANCVAYANPVAWTVAAGDGSKTVYVQVVDVAGNRSAVVSDAIVLDTTAPSGTVTLTGGAAAVDTENTTYTASASDTNGVAAMCVRESPATQPAANDPCFVTYSTAATAITLAGIDGTKTVYAWFRDAAGLVSTSAATDSVFLDRTAPTLSAASLNGGATYANSLSVSMGFTASDTGGSGLSQVCMSTTAGSPQGGCAAYANPAPFTFSAGEGTRTLYVQVRDVANNLTAVASDSIIIDTTRPTGTVSLAAGAAAVNTTGITYTVSAADTNGVASMCVRESPSTQPAANDPCFVTYSTAATAISLSAGDGMKTVYAWFLDSAGNVSATAATDTILLDTVAPVLTSATLNSGDAYTNSTSVTFGSVASDTGGSGVAQVCRSNTSGSPQANCVTYLGSVAHTLTTGDGLKTAYLQVVDTAGNRSTVLSDTITLDTTAPTLTSISVNAGATYTNTTSVTVTTVGSDTNGFADIAFSNDGTTFGTPVAWISGGNTYTLPAGDGAKTVYARVRDPAGNVSVVRSDGITLDATRPTGTVVINGGAAWSTSTAVNLTLSAADGTGSGVAQMCIKSTNVAPTLPTDACFEAYATTRNGFDLGTTQGTRTVYVWFLDTADNISSPAATDTIGLDTVAPGVPGSLSCSSGHRTIDCTSATTTDGTSGVAGYELGYSRTSGSGYTVAGPIANPNTGWSITGLQNQVYWYTVVRAVDVAGNVGAWSAQVSPYPRFPFTYEHREPTSANFNAVMATSPTTWVAVGDFGNARRSTNTMATSARIDVLSDGNLRGLHKDPSGQLYVVGDNGHYAWSDDDGLTWDKGVVNSSATLTAITNGLNTTVGLSTTRWLVAVGLNGTILRGGRTALFLGGYGSLSLSAVTSPTTNHLRSVTATESLDYLIAVGDNGTMVRSADNGVTWTTMAAPTGYTAAPFRVVVPYLSGASSNNVYVGTRPQAATGTGSSSVLYCNVAAGTCAESGSFNDISVYGMHQMNEGGSGRWFLTGHDMSGTSELTVPKIVTFATGTGITVETLSSGVSQRGNAIYAFEDTANGDVNVVSVGLEGQVTYEPSWSGGAANSWIDANSGADVSLTDIDMASNNASYGFMAGTSGYFGVTGSTGNSWTQYTSDAGTTTFYGVAAAGTTTPYTGYAVGSGGTVYTGTTSTSAATRMTSPTTNTLRGVQCFAAGNCYAVGDVMTVLRLSGTTWSSLSLTGASYDYNALTLWMDSGTQRGVLVGDTGAYRTLTGTTWSAETTNTTVGNWVAVASNGTGTVLASSDNIGSGNGYLYRSTTNGTSWSSISTLPWSSAGYLRSLSFGGGTTWYGVAANGAIWKSTNDGTNWTLLVSNSGTNQTLYGSACYPASNYVFAVGVNGTVLRSLYGGE